MITGSAEVQYSRGKLASDPELAHSNLKVLNTVEVDMDGINIFFSSFSALQ